MYPSILQKHYDSFKIYSLKDLSHMWKCLRLIDKTPKIYKLKLVYVKAKIGKAQRFSKLKLITLNSLDKPIYKISPSITKANLFHPPSADHPFFRYKSLKFLIGGWRQTSDKTYIGQATTKITHPHFNEKVKFIFKVAVYPSSSKTTLKSTEDLIGGLLKKLKLPFKDGSFSYNFRELSQVTKGLETLNLTQLKEYLDRIRSETGNPVTILGISVPISALRNWGSFILICIQLYFLLHFSHACSLFKNINYVAWIGLYDDKPSRRTFLVSVCLLPITTILLINFGSLFDSTAQFWFRYIFGIVLFITSIVLSWKTYKIIMHWHKAE